MLTTNKVKIKERSQEDVKLTMLTTNKTKPKEFELKGKGKPYPEVAVTTSNLSACQSVREEERKIEDKATKIRKKKYDLMIKKVRVEQELAAQEKDATIEEQIKALDKKKRELEAKLGK